MPAPLCPREAAPIFSLWGWAPAACAAPLFTGVQNFLDSVVYNLTFNLRPSQLRPDKRSLRPELRQEVLVAEAVEDQFGVITRFFKL